MLNQKGAMKQAGNISVSMKQKKSAWHGVFTSLYPLTNFGQRRVKFFDRTVIKLWKPSKLQIDIAGQDRDGKRAHTHTHIM